MKDEGGWRRWVLPLLLFAAVFGALAAAGYYRLTNNETTPVIDESEPPAETKKAEEPKQVEMPQVENQASEAETQDKTSKDLPSSVRLDVPFLVQAPFANWDPLHEDACEEASLIMVRHFRDGTKVTGDEIGDNEIKAMVAYEESAGYGLSITLAELNEIADSRYSLKTGRIEPASIESIKAELAGGRPVIVPAAGKILPNPNFRNGGPNYHMLVVTGYDESGFITNDPGTRKGKGFRYSENALIVSTHDWDPEDILNGAKRYLVFD